MANLPSLGSRGEGWVAIQAILFGVILLTGLTVPGGWSGPGAGVASFAGVLLEVVGGTLAVAGLVGLRAGDALTAVPHPREGAKLVETGIYRLVRHPIYGGLVFAGAGWALLRGSFPALLGVTVLFAFFDLKRRREEAWLVERFPGYTAYRARTRRFIPWLW